jgi:hypothetical protein
VDNTKRSEMMIGPGLLSSLPAHRVRLPQKQPFALNKQFTGYTLPALWYWDAFTKDIHLAQ